MTRDDLQEALQHPNVKAFLKAIRLGEGTSGEDGYNIIVGGERFDDFSKHPEKLVYLEKYKTSSSAAGAYQILRRTWNELVRQYGFPDFSPECQDEAAVALIAGRGALYNVKRGELPQAIEKCRLEWASLPGSPYGQRTEDYANVERVYLENGGTLA